MTSSIENIPLSVGLSIAKLRCVIQSLTENVETLQAKQLESEEKIKEFKKEIELARSKESDSSPVISLGVSHYKEEDSSATSLEIAKLHKDLEEALFIMDRKAKSIDALNKKVILVESDLAQKNIELSQKNAQLKNVDMMVSVFEKNLSSVRSQFTEVQERFIKEQASVEKLKKTHVNIMQSQKMHQEDIDKLTLENKTKQSKINAQDATISELYGKLSEQKALLEEMKLKHKSVGLRTTAQDFAEETRKEKEFLCESLKASERLLTDTTKLLRQREEAYSDLSNEKARLAQHIEELKSKLEEKINAMECTGHQKTIQTLEELTSKLTTQNKELAEKVKTYLSREIVFKEEVALQDKKLDRANEELQAVSKSLQSFKDLTALQEKKLETYQSEAESQRVLIVKLEEELRKANDKAMRQLPVLTQSISPPKPIAQSDSPLSVGGRKFFTPPLPQPMTSSPAQRPVRPALVYANDDDQQPRLEDEKERPEIEVTNNQIKNYDDIPDLFVLDFDSPSPPENQFESMDIDNAEDDAYEVASFQRASAMYPSAGRQPARLNHQPTATKRKNNLDDFIQVTPRGRAAPSKPMQPQHISSSNSQQTNNVSNTSTTRAPIGPSFSTYRYKQPAKKPQSSNSNTSSNSLGCCSETKHGAMVQCTSCRKKFHHSCLKQGDNRITIKEPFTCASCTGKRKPRAKK